ncbi:hypothetical protein JTE90_004549 [Oedothorax gibbosus]|uniref:C2H2-type domain-containing protein n=1 Tax=Oedothorax gibbosus TaxID=931172 RepID=A0AAV6VF98_9ARAC|nr:hypothetical protein JTE90_004549 [Oedothorax gibbosus]
MLCNISFIAKFPGTLYCFLHKHKDVIHHSFLPQHIIKPKRTSTVFSPHVYMFYFLSLKKSEMSPFEPERKIHTCRQCPFSSVTLLEMMKHTKSHDWEAQFACTSCHKIFSTKTLLNRHLKVHTGERPYECTVCHRMFTQKTHLQYHVLTHVKDA